MISERVDKSMLVHATFDDTERDDVRYWMAKTPTERVEAGEYLRRWVYGDDQVERRLQRVLESVELGAD